MLLGQVSCWIEGEGLTNVIATLQAGKIKLTIDLDVAAPHLIIPEDFSSQDSSLVCLRNFTCLYLGAYIFKVCLYLGMLILIFRGAYFKCAYV